MIYILYMIIIDGEREPSTFTKSVLEITKNKVKYTGPEKLRHKFEKIVFFDNLTLRIDVPKYTNLRDADTSVNVQKKTIGETDKFWIIRYDVLDNWEDVNIANNVSNKV